MRFKIMTIILLISLQSIQAKFDPCKFNFGMAYNGDISYPSEIDYMTIWAGSDEDFNQYWIGDMLNKCKSSGKTPVFYSYIIAFTARRDMGLKDCNVGTPNLCQQGAKYIRENKSRITGQYQKYVSATKNIWGTTEPIIWLMEPDYFQYASGDQEGGGLSYTALATLMHELVGIIKDQLPNAVISMDISPWADQNAWFGAFQLNDFTYVNTSGGETEANSSKIRNANATTWSGTYSLTGKHIIADDGYGAAGSSTGHDASWDVVSNLNARIADGVIAITQANPVSNWGSTIATVRPQLSAITGCNQQPTKYTLTTTTTGSGTVSASPQATSYESGASVTLTATPANGFTFTGWSGALSGSSNPATVVMSSDKSVTAIFTAVTQTKYTLTTTTTGSGTVSASPQATSYESGASVTLTATPANGFAFTGWSGAISGSSNPVTVVMSSNKSVTATFTAISANEFTVSVTTTGSGAVTVSPQAASYASGTTVTLTATPSSGASFTGWSGDLSGSNATATLVMNSNKTVTAAFSGGNLNTTNLVTNGDFSGGETGWSFGVYENAVSRGSITGGEYNVNTSTAGSANWNIQLSQTGIVLQQGKTYNLTFSARAASNTTIEANVGMSGGDYSSYSEAREISLTSTMQTFTVTFTMSSTTDNDARLEFNSGTSGISWFLDNVSLKESTVSIKRSHFKAVAALPGLSRNATVSVYDHTGRLIWQKSGTNRIPTEISGLKSGSYIAVIKDGNTSLVKKHAVVDR